MEKSERLAVFLETVTICKQGHYWLKDKSMIMLPTLGIPMSKFYNKEITPKSRTDCDTHIEVLNKDCLYVAKDLIDLGLNPAVLNMASARMPCGGVLRGSGAQEENISRRSNLFQSLYKYHDIGKDFEIPQDERNINNGISYPLDPNFGGIYSKDVVVFREGEDKQYELLHQPFKVDIISVAAINRPDYDDDFKFSQKTENIEKDKIRTIFNIALDNGNDSLVLGAFGCGAFKTPPAEMARCFHEVIEETPYKNKFNTIIFAILDDHNAYKEHNPQGNFKPFKEEFS